MPSKNSKLKITHFASGDLWAGAEKQLCTLVTQLSKDSSLEIAVVLMNEGELAGKLRKQGIPLTIFDEQSKNGAGIFIDVLAYLRKLKPDIVHTHGHKENILVSVANALTWHAGNVRTVHGASEHTHTGLKQLHKRLLSRMDILTGNYLADRIVAVTEDLEQKLEGIYRREKLTVIVNGIDTTDSPVTMNTSDFRKDMPDKYHIGIAGRLYRVKRVDIFLETARLLVEKSPEKWHFHVFGDGPLMQEYRELAHRLEINEQVTFHGHRKDMQECLASLELLVMCSDHEGMPMVALESIMAGTPVIAHATGGLIGLLEQFSEVLLNKDNSVETFVYMIETYFQYDRKEIIEILQNYVREKYSAVTNARQWLELYRSIYDAHK